MSKLFFFPCHVTNFTRMDRIYSQPDASVQSFCCLFNVPQPQSALQHLWIYFVDTKRSETTAETTHCSTGSFSPSDWVSSSPLRYDEPLWLCPSACFCCFYASLSKFLFHPKFQGALTPTSFGPNFQIFTAWTWTKTTGVKPPPVEPLFRPWSRLSGGKYGLGFSVSHRANVATDGGGRLFSPAPCCAPPQSEAGCEILPSWLTLRSCAHFTTIITGSLHHLVWTF